jgi:hypothetical protein
MAVSANTYGTLARVHVRLGDLFDDGQASTIDRITAAQIEQILDDVASEMNAMLDAYGYTAPIAVGDDPFAHSWATSANVAGACIRILASLPGESFDPDNPDMLVGGRIASFQSEYKRFMAAITDGVLKATRSVSRMGRFKVGSATDRRTGLEKKPAFRRDMLDFPGSVVRLAKDDE